MPFTIFHLQWRHINIPKCLTMGFHVRYSTCYTKAYDSYIRWYKATDASGRREKNGHQNEIDQLWQPYFWYCARCGNWVADLQEVLHPLERSAVFDLDYFAHSSVKDRRAYQTA